VSWGSWEKHITVDSSRVDEAEQYHPATILVLDPSVRHVEEPAIMQIDCVDLHLAQGIGPDPIDLIIRSTIR